MPRILRASLRPNAGVLFVLGGSAVGGFGYRYWAAKDGAESSTLHPFRFSQYAIAAKEPVSSTSSLFTLRACDTAAAEQQDLAEVWARGVWSIEAKQPQLQIARAYTPLPPTSPTAPETEKSRTTEHDASELHFLIRRERGGEVSNYLHRLPEGATVEIRGPHVEFEIPEDVSEVLFLAGGTGIAPALQVAYAMQQRQHATRMRILWANRRREECIGGTSDNGVSGSAGSSWKRWFGLGRSEQTQDAGVAGGEKGIIVRELEALKRRAAPEQQLAVDYFVDEENNFIKPAHVTQHLHAATQPSPSTATGSRLILISGPDGFVDYWAGRKVWAEQGEIQGPLRGTLSRMDLKGWRVWKL